MTRTAVTFTPEPYAETSLSPVASRFATNAVRRSTNHASATEPIVSNAPGIQPIDCASGSDQLGVADTGDLEIVIDRPTRTKSTPVEATTGCSRTTATSTPVTAPMPAAVAEEDAGWLRYQSPRPAGRSTAMKRQLMKVASGPTDTSMPPERIDGVDANPTSTNGRERGQSGRQSLGRQEVGTDQQVDDEQRDRQHAGERPGVTSQEVEESVHAALSVLLTEVGGDDGAVVSRSRGISAKTS